MYSLREGFTEDERARLSLMLDRVYAEFVQKVADGRSMDVAAVDAVARGRIWSGADAAGNGLVDVLGGICATPPRSRARRAGCGPTRRSGPRCTCHPSSGCGAR